MKKIIPLMLALMLGFSTWAQNNPACPGLKNPASFTAGSTSGIFVGYYSGQTGSKPYTAPDAVNGVTGVNMSGSVLTAGQLSSQSSSCSGQTPEPGKRFRIMSRYEGPGSGANLGKDPNSNYGLSYCPTSYDNLITNSIRLGNQCTGAEAEGLYYTMNVRVQNALLFIYYSIVVEAPGHGPTGDPSFVIRVTRQNGSNWQQISDTLCYAVSSSGLTNGIDGWHQIGSGYNTVFYRDWNKVAINLNKYIYEQVRIEIYMGDCAASGHYGYCYIAGDCQPMEIQTSGCPAGATTEVQTLTAPEGLMDYSWHRSNIDGAEIPTLNGISDNIHFTQLGSDSNVYHAQVEDFRILEGPNRDSLTNNMVFRCDMTSAMDPAKPFTSKVYVRVINTKPLMAIDTLKNCDGGLTLTNKSYVPNDIRAADTANSEWWFYAGSDTLTDLVRTSTGAVTYHRWDSLGVYAVKVRTYNIDDHECFSEATYPIHVLGRPNTQIGLTDRELCENDSVYIWDATDGSVRRDWVVNGQRLPGDRNNGNQRHGYVFTNYKNPIELIAYNGLYTRDSINTYDTIWCTKSAFDTIEVFLHPELEVAGDTVVCNGQSTDITVSTETEGCSYRWYLDPQGNNQLATGQNLKVLPYADTCVYYVKVTSRKGCIAWCEVNAYRVNPKLSISRHDMCEGDNVTLNAKDAFSYSWIATPTDSTLLELLDEDGHGPAEITVSPKETTVYTLIGHGTNNCNADPLTEQITIHPIPVPTVSTTPNFVDSDNPVVTFTDESPYSVRRVWQFNEGTPEEYGSPTSHNFGEVSSDSVEVTMIAYNDLDCSDQIKFRLPVTQFTFFAPNIFFPERPDNNHFSIFTANQQENFSIYIYDRQGRQVFTSTDLNFRWDGNTLDGIKCPQGAYNWVVRYRRPNTEDIVTQKGAITLVR